MSFPLKSAPRAWRHPTKVVYQTVKRYYQIIQKHIWLYITFIFSWRFYPKQLTTIHSHIPTPTAESTTQGDSQLVRSIQGEASCSDLTGDLHVTSQPALPPDPLLHHYKNHYIIISLLQWMMERARAGLDYIENCYMMITMRNLHHIITFWSDWGSVHRSMSIYVYWIIPTHNNNNNNNSQKVENPRQL